LGYGLAILVELHWFVLFNEYNFCLKLPEDSNKMSLILKGEFLILKR